MEPGRERRANARPIQKLPCVATESDAIAIRVEGAVDASFAGGAVGEGRKSYLKNPVVPACFTFRCGSMLSCVASPCSDREVSFNLDWEGARNKPDIHPTESVDSILHLRKSRFSHLLNDNQCKKDTNGFNK